MYVILYQVSSNKEPAREVENSYVHDTNWSMPMFNLNKP